MRVLSLILSLMGLLCAGGCDLGGSANRGDAGMCRTTCDSCGAGESCVTLTSAAVFGPTYHAACLKPCQTNEDCPAGDHCRIQTALLSTTAGPRYCVHDGNPPLCPQLLSGSCEQALYGTECIDDLRLARPFRDGDVCGSEAVACPSRCVRGGAADAATNDGGIPEAHCE